MRRITYAALCLMAFCCGAPQAAGLVLVEDGVAKAPIVIFEDAPPFTRRAAEELAEYIKKTSGAKPEVIEGRPDPLPEHAVWVGYQPVLEELFPGVDFDFQHPEDILIAANESHLVIAGRDRWDPEALTVELRRRTVRGFQQEYGTVNAVYTFLQERLGVRWLWPGELGEDILRSETLAFEPFEFRYRPPIRYRSGLIRLSALDGRGHSHQWTRFQRLQLDSLQLMGGHPFSGWWERFGEEHPEYFALQPDGTRGGFPSARAVKLCKSNPAVWDRWMAEVEATLEQNPNERVFGAAANDAGSGGFCICEDCRAWDHPDGKLLRHYWQGLTQQYVAQTDRQVRFANTLARMLRERYPDRDYYVLMQAYGNSRPAPIGVEVDDNVIVSAVFNFHNRPSFDSRIGMDHRELFLEWAEAAPHIAWRPNLGHGAGLQHGLLNVGTANAIKDLRLAAEKGVTGLFFDTLTEHWATQGPYYYILARMAWDPYADGEAILDDYYRRGFGRAADAIRGYWTAVEDAAQRIVFDGEDMAEVWDEAFFERMRGTLGRAEAALEGEPEVYAKRVGFVRAGLDFTEAAIEARRLMERFEASEGRDREAEDAARALWIERIRPLAESEEHPHAFNAFLVVPGRWPYRSGYFPDDLRGRW